MPKSTANTYKVRQQPLRSNPQATLRVWYLASYGPSLTEERGKWNLKGRFDPHLQLTQGYTIANPDGQVGEIHTPCSTYEIKEIGKEKGSKAFHYAAAFYYQRLRSSSFCRSPTHLPTLRYTTRYYPMEEKKNKNQRPSIIIIRPYLTIVGPHSSLLTSSSGDLTQTIFVFNHSSICPIQKVPVPP